MELWEHQKALIGRVYKLIKEGTRRILVASSTGSGKTVVFSRITLDALSRGRRVLIVVDDSPLVPQTLAKLERLGVGAGVIKAGYKPDYTLPVQVASVDTLIRREFPPADVVIIDEAHLSYADKYKALLDRTEGFYNKSIIMGFTATPERTNKKESLLRDWDALVTGLTIQEAIAEGVNCPFVLYSIKSGTLDLRHVKTSRGDFVVSELSTAMSAPSIITQAVDEWENKALGLKTIGFGADIAHIDRLAEEFIRRGHSCGTIKGTDGEEDRAKKFAQLRGGTLQVLLSVNVLTLGFDEPSVECVLCCRPTKSMVVWVQQVGRALRRHEGKTQAVILDQAENTRRLLHPLSYEPPDLHTPRRPTGEAPTKTCPDCAAEVLTFVTTCPHCGYTFPPPQPKKTKLEEMVEVAAQITNPKLLHQKRKYTSLMNQAIAKGNAPEWAAIKFKETYGFYPSNLHTLHAIYGAAFTEENMLAFAHYLHKVAQRRVKDKGWVARHLAKEFGRGRVDGAPHN